MNSPQKFEEEFLTCGICFDIFNEPKVLPCLHTFCLSCLSSYISTTAILNNRTAFSCPTCREVIHPPRPKDSTCNWSQQFRDNFYVNNLIDANKNQELTIIANEEKACPSHDTPLQLFCVDCDKIICVQCSVVSHRSCRQILPVKDIATEKRSQLLSYRSSLQGQILKISNSLKEIERETHNMDLKKTALRVSIKKKGDEMTKLVAMETAATLSRLDGAVAASKNELEADYAFKQTLMLSLTDVSNTIDKVINTPDSYMFDEMDIVLKDREKSLKALPRKIEMPVFQLQFKESTPPSSIIGEVVKTSARRTLTELLVDVPGPSGAAQSLLSDQSPFITKYKSFKMISEINAKSKSDNSKASLRDLCVLSGNLIVVTDYGNKKIKSFYRHGTEFKESESIVPAPPHSITKIGSFGNQVAVTLPAAKQIAIVAINPAVIIDKLIKTTKKFWGITSIGATGFAVSTCSGSEPGLIIIMDIDGNELKTLSSAKRYTTNPLYLATLSSGDMVISDCTIGRIIKLRQSGEVVSVKDRFNNVLTSPMGICTDQKDGIIVADNKHVTILNEIGQVKKQIDLSLSKSQKARSVFVSNDDDVYVLTETNQILVYTACS